jgi:hypothetical protein
MILLLDCLYKFLVIVAVRLRSSAKCTICTVSAQLKLDSSIMLTDKEFGNYLSYRFKLNELIHLHLLFHALNDGSCGESICGVPKEQVLMSVRTVALAWFATAVETGVSFSPNVATKHRIPSHPSKLLLT